VKPSKSYKVTVQKSIHASCKRVFEALTQPAHLNRWFTKRASIKLGVGGAYHNGDGDKGTILKIVPRRQLTYTWENESHAPGSRVSFVLRPNGQARSILRITQSRMPKPTDVHNQRMGWGWAGDALKEYLESGRIISFDDWLSEHNKQLLK
jgi:uncharacterized protein YndB with AHSA1/START domain